MVVGVLVMVTAAAGAGGGADADAAVDRAVGRHLHPQTEAASGESGGEERRAARQPNPTHTHRQQKGGKATAAPSHTQSCCSRLSVCQCPLPVLSLSSRPACSLPSAAVTAEAIATAAASAASFLPAVVVVLLPASLSLALAARPAVTEAATPTPASRSPLFVRV